MKATGIVRRIDDLGRVVIPKEIRRTLRIREGDPLEIFTDREGEVILKKYSPIGELGDFAKEYADSLHEAVNHITCIADRDAIIAVAGAPKKEFLDKPISPDIEKIMEERKTVLVNKGDGKYYRISADEEENRYKYTAEVITPIIAEGDPIGSVILLSKDENVKMGDLEVKLAETAAGFLAKQMEQ
ncbi:MAG: AbrB family transcriptional regulator, stage sporulation protein [Thermosediminibacterales bacterium]|nr:AbrB family transcriptional regulator, stage sporulation protein [Thermosediminibacterales bacterium]MDK2836756.1 AbrB family transcriptional regulator, stage sporulation protein [Thermosediminibacterales bacterium]